MPVLHRQVKDEDGDEVNIDGDRDNDQFVHRFTLFDGVSGVDEDAAPLGDDASDAAAHGAAAYAPRVLRYAKKMRLLVKGQIKSPDRLLPPILELTYVEREPQAWMEGSAPEELTGAARAMGVGRIHFEVEYSCDTTQFWDVLEVLFFIAMGVWGLAFLARYNNWRSRTLSAELNDSTIASTAGMSFLDYWRLLLILAHTFVLVYFPFIVCMCTYWFVFFKIQGTVYLMLPPEDPEAWQENAQYYKLESMIITLWVLQSAWMLDLVFRQSFELETFFVDWENARESAQRTPVSIWRTILVANEWNKLQSATATNLPGTLLALAFLLVGCGIQYHATPQPHLSDRREGHLNMALRFANTTWWFAILAFAQWLWRTFVSERLFGEPKVRPRARRRRERAGRVLPRAPDAERAGQDAHEHPRAA